MSHPTFFWYTAFGFAFTLFCLCILLFTPSLDDRAYYPQVFIVSEGENIRTIAEQMREKHIVNSQTLFIVSNYLVGGKILWGSYHLSEPRGVFTRARKMYVGDKNAPFKRIAVPEGSNLYEIADILEESFSNFDREKFEERSISKHGYLYPDTYFFTADGVSAKNLIAVMTETFKRRTDDLFESYEGPLTQDEIVALASIVELEANRQEDRRRIAGVLFNRLEKDLPLQVDVSFLFIAGKHTFQLSKGDLTIDDPSNTYKYKGIPSIPIGNPSREAIEAVLNPIESDDMFFLADFHGNTYFSETYDQHLIKKAKYIDSVRDQYIGGRAGSVEDLEGDDNEGDDGVSDDNVGDEQDDGFSNEEEFESVDDDHEDGFSDESTEPVSEDVIE